MPLAMRIHPVLLPLFSYSPFAFLTASSAVALYQARGQPWTAAFVASAYVNLMLLFRCLRMFETVTPGDLRKRMQLKIAISCLATTLNASFCHQVSKLMHPAVSVLLWCLVILVAAGGFWIFFVYDSCCTPRPLARAPPNVGAD